MKKTIVSLLLFTSLTHFSAAASNESLTIEPLPTPDTYRLQWDGRANFVYFIYQSADLEIWSYLPTYKFPSSSGPLTQGIDTDAEKLFFRVVGSYDPQSTLLSGDFNGSRISNIQEILQGTDPFVWEDLPPNGLPDSWELFWFGASGTITPSGDSDMDGLTESQEFSSATDPTVPDHPLVQLLVSTPLISGN